MKCLLLSKWALDFKLTGTFVHPNGNHILANPAIEIVLWPRCCHLLSKWTPPFALPFQMSASSQMLQNEHPFPPNKENGYPTLLQSFLARSQNKYPPQLFCKSPQLFVWKHRSRYRFVQADRCPSALSIAQWPAVEKLGSPNALTW